MRELHLVGVHEDGEHLVVVDADHQSFRVPIDDALRAAVRRDRLPRGQTSPAGHQAMRPREIQYRIRAGHDAADIAAASGIPVEHIRKYEGPILAERRNVVLRARQTALRRRDGLAPSLAQTCDERLASRGVNLQDDTDWDAWRAEDGSWLIQLRFLAADTERAATWRYDLASVHLTPIDDEAKSLSDEPRHMPRPTRTDTARHRLDRVLRRTETHASEPASDAPTDTISDRTRDRTSDTVEIGDRGAISAGGRSRFPANVIEDVQSSPVSDASDSLEHGSSGHDPDRTPPPAHPAHSHPHERPDSTVLSTSPSSSPNEPIDTPHLTTGDRTEHDDRQADHEPPQGGDDLAHSDSADSDLGHEYVLIEESADIESQPLAEDVSWDHHERPNDDVQLDEDAQIEGPEQIDGQAQIDLGLGAAPTAAPASSSTRRSRPSVPSWDDILFGSKKS